MNVGGYQIIDLKNHNFVDNVDFTIEGIYNKIESTRKPILISGFQYEGKEMHNQFCSCVVNGSNYDITYHKSSGDIWIGITVQDNDVITVHEI